MGWRGVESKKCEMVALFEGCAVVRERRRRSCSEKAGQPMKRAQINISHDSRRDVSRDGEP